MERKFCQSCGMPLDESGQYGTETDGSRSEDYCVYCYSNGKFTFTGSMEDMIEICVPHLLAAHKGMTKDEVRGMMQGFLPNLKRWRAPDQQKLLEDKSLALLTQSATVVLCSISEEGYPRPCTLVRIGNDGIKKIYVATGASSRKTEQFRRNAKAGLCFSDAENGVTLTGTVRILTDPQERSQYWQDWMIAHFPGGVSDPEFCVLEFTSHQATFWIDHIFESCAYA
ncbi:MAG: zinc ribbon domain-containing protein [Planctomycetia bacterium]|nr:zinc ribbon domain-containing protein [Planctomycetia bacterium]